MHRRAFWRGRVGQGGERRLREYLDAVRSRLRDGQAPVSGVVTEINELLSDSPNIVNESPLEGGWFVKVKMADSAGATPAVRFGRGLC